MLAFYKVGLKKRPTPYMDLDKIHISPVQLGTEEQMNVHSWG